MKFISFLFRLVFCILLTLLLVFPFFLTFNSIFTATSFVIPYAIYPFDICKVAPIAWKYIKLAYCLTCFYVYFVVSNSIFSKITKNKMAFKKPKSTQQNLPGINLYLGTNSQNLPVYITEKGLFQNILITGTIGTGKTSSSMYPFAKQLIDYNSYNPFEKLRNAYFRC